VAFAEGVEQVIPVDDKEDRDRDSKQPIAQHVTDGRVITAQNLAVQRDDGYRQRHFQCIEIAI
jgi:hypothetical protein